jgi:hypothetical protein
MGMEGLKTAQSPKTRSKKIILQNTAGLQRLQKSGPDPQKFRNSKKTV